MGEFKRKVNKEIKIMNATELNDSLNRSDVLRNILGSYKDLFSIGVIEEEGKLAILLTLRDKGEHVFPSSVSIDGNTYELKLVDGFIEPESQQRTEVKIASSVGNAVGGSHI